MELNRIFEFFGQVYQKADVKAVFGEPQTIGKRVIIPVAQIGYGLGLGWGEGRKPGTEEGEAETGGGGGGGGGGHASPIAVLEVSETDTRVIPIVNSTRIAMAAILTGAWCIFWITRTIRVFRRRGV